MKLSADDRLWALAVKERDDWRCVMCSRAADPRGLHAHHIFTRSRRSTRHDVDNGVTLCFGHHRWVHANPLEWHSLIAEVMGQERYDELQAKSRQQKRRGT